MLLNNTFLNTTEEPKPNDSASRQINRPRYNYAFKKVQSNTIITSTRYSQPYHYKHSCDTKKYYLNNDTKELTEKSNVTTLRTSPQLIVTESPSLEQVSLNLNQRPQIVLDLNTPPGFMLKSYNIQHEGNSSAEHGGLNDTEDGLTNFTLIQEIICFPNKKSDSHELTGNITTAVTPAYKESNNDKAQVRFNKMPLLYKPNFVHSVSRTTTGHKNTNQNKNSAPLFIHVFQKSKSLRHEDSDSNQVKETKNNVPLLPEIPLPDVIHDGEHILDTMHNSLKTKVTNEKITPRINIGKSRIDSNVYALYTKETPKQTKPVVTYNYGKQMIPEFPEQNSYPCEYYRNAALVNKNSIQGSHPISYGGKETLHVYPYRIVGQYTNTNFSSAVTI
ncbi:hypothetical protein WDU94_014776 [Cyamophila willieti]